MKIKVLMRKIPLFLAATAIALALSSCGSEFDGTWVSQADPNTSLSFSGSRVTIKYSSFKISGTYETDDDGNITFTLTDSGGSKYKIVAEASIYNEDTLTLTNSNGGAEVFKK